MITVNLRQQGGAAIMTVPSDVLKMLNIQVGATLELEVTGNAFTVHPVQKAHRKRYSLKELLHGVTPQKMKALHAKTKWFREGKPVGREII